MAGYQDLSNFERGLIVGHGMGHSISEAAMKFGYSHTTISRVYHEYRVSDFNAGALRNVSVRTVERTIIDMGFRNRCPTSVPLLTVRHTALRLAWVSQRRHRTVDDWKQVAWSDESRFQLYRVDGHVLVWRQPHESMDPTCQQGTV
ncbi:hypothetical protein AVEN_135392-1 [Araneus ventricosus]|uniref:Transposase Tc1-like domain-containing protein n=1 Tax=Araneus ventricosus TaxID=182803 RepID=A0A4Y2KXP7_ARAVE|nr:hypothetical protein AVEN_135392-1 [Araneus ventricosus]